MAEGRREKGTHLVLTPLFVPVMPAVLTRLCFCQGAPKEVLLKKFETSGVESMSVLEMRRLKRLLTKEEIKDFNMNKVLEKSD